jgi:hypothetical protein
MSETMRLDSTVAGNVSEVATVIERAIRRRTGNRVRNLRVEWSGESVVVQGSTGTYYLKQLALEAACSTLAGLHPLIIDIVVI